MTPTRSNQSRPCGACQGKGTVPDPPNPEEKPCDTCGGSGRLTGNDF